MQQSVPLRHVGDIASGAHDAVDQSLTRIDANIRITPRCQSLPFSNRCISEVNLSSLLMIYVGLAIPGAILFNIVPSSSRLQANLYAQSRAFGFINRGQAVKLKVDAFPYQKFGLIRGIGERSHYFRL